MKGVLKISYVGEIFLLYGAIEKIGTDREVKKRKRVYLYAYFEAYKKHDESLKSKKMG